MLLCFVFVILQLSKSVAAFLWYNDKLLNVTCCDQATNKQQTFIKNQHDIKLYEYNNSNNNNNNNMIKMELKIEIKSNQIEYGI